MLSNIASEYFNVATRDTAVVGSEAETKTHESAATLSINPYAFAEFVATAPAEAVALGNITAALNAIKNASKHEAGLHSDTLDTYTITYTDGTPVESGITYLTVTITHTHEWYGEMGYTSDKTLKTWTLEGVVCVQRNKAEREYYFLTAELEAWLRAPGKPKRAVALAAICA